MKTATILDVLSSFNEEQLNELAAKLNAPKGKVPAKTAANIASTIENGQARLSIHFAIKPPYPDAENPDTNMIPVAIGKMYTYKDPVAAVNPN